MLRVVGPLYLKSPLKLPLIVLALKDRSLQDDKYLDLARPLVFTIYMKFQSQFRY